MPYEYINITDDEDGEVQTQLEGEDTRKCLFCLKYRGGGGGTQLEGEDTRKCLLCLTVSSIGGGGGGGADPARGRRYEKTSPLSQVWGGVRGLRFESVQGYFLPYEYINITDDADGEVQTQLEGEDTRNVSSVSSMGGGVGQGGLGLNQYKAIFAL